MRSSEALPRFLLNGEEVLSGAYDPQGDVLYLWLGDKATPAVSVSTPEGHLVRLDLVTHELVGITIFDWERKWRALGSIELHTPLIEEDHARAESREYRVEPVPA